MPMTGTRMCRISWLAKALDATASDEKTARPTVLDSRWSGAAEDSSGRPTSRRLAVE
jgi:hypothetical protein